MHEGTAAHGRNSGRGLAKLIPTCSCTNAQALQASSSLALRRAERCDAAEAETARLQGEVVHLRTEEKRLRLLEERLEQAQSLMQDKESAERRADHATRRADTAEQRAKTLESHAKSLELQLLTVTTDLEAANLAVQEAHDKTRLQSEELTAELKLTEAARSEMEIKLKEVLQELANTNAGNAALRRKVDADILELNAQLSDSRARCERGDVQLEAEREKSQHATNKALLLEDQVAKMQDREMTSNAEVSGLLEENATLRKDLARANAAREAAEQRVAPLASEASKLKDEKLAAEEEAKSCRLQMEATRMAHYEQDLTHTHTDMCVCVCGSMKRAMVHTLHIYIYVYRYNILRVFSSGSQACSGDGIWDFFFPLLVQTVRGHVKHVVNIRDSTWCQRLGLSAEVLKGVP